MMKQLSFWTEEEMGGGKKQVPGVSVHLDLLGKSEAVQKGYELLIEVTAYTSMTEARKHPGFITSHPADYHLGFYESENVIYAVEMGEGEKLYVLVNYLKSIWDGTYEYQHASLHLSQISARRYMTSLQG
jgi:hypothetical protein